MKAIILAAGKSTRLLPLTKEIPQPLLKVGKKAILEHQIDLLKHVGVNDIVVITGYLSEQIEIFCKSKNVKTVFNPFYEVSGMALTLWSVKNYIKDDFLFLYSDILFDYKVLVDLMKKDDDICLAIKKNGLREEAEKVIESDGLIENVTKSEISGENGEFIGLAKFSKQGSVKLLNMLDIVAKINLKARFIDLIDRLIVSGERIAAFDIEKNKFIDIDFSDDLKNAKKLFF